MKMLTKDEITTAVQSIVAKIQRIGFYILVLLLIGACGGYYFAIEQAERRMDDCIQMKSMKYKGDVYIIEFDPTRSPDRKVVTK